LCLNKICVRESEGYLIETLINKTQELEQKIDSLEKQQTNQEQNISDNSNSIITGNIISDENSQKQNFFTKFWNKLFKK
jgi:uncharacterized coiled-coil protein SlyX